MNKLVVFVAVALLAGMAFAATGCDSGDVLYSVCSAVYDVCTGLKSMLPIAGMLAIVLAGVIYAAGQMMGAETRARANVWATAALTGALFAILMAVVGPAVLNIIYGGTGATAISTACGT